MSVEQQRQTLNVITQNMLLDYTRTRKGLMLPQDDRINVIAETITSFDGNLDVVGIQEAHQSKVQHNGEVLAASCGYGPGFWVNHNQKPYPEAPKGRSGEYIGLFGRMVDNAEPIELGDNRKAVMSVIGYIAFVTLHLRSGIDARKTRQKQVEKLIEALEPYESSVVFGDFNEPPIRYFAKARNALKEGGFQSVFPLTGQRHPVTNPTEPYKMASAEGRGWEGVVINHGWSIDDIMIRGQRVRALGAGVLNRVELDETNAQSGLTVPSLGSDHDGLWATLEISS